MREEETAVRYPIWSLVRAQGRNLVWLARVTGYRHAYVRLVACGASPVTAEFRRRCVRALNLPEEVLFDGREQRSA